MKSPTAPTRTRRLTNRAIRQAHHPERELFGPAESEMLFHRWAAFLAFVVSGPVSPRPGQRSRPNLQTQNGNTAR